MVLAVAWSPHRVQRRRRGPDARHHHFIHPRLRAKVYGRGEIYVYTVGGAHKQRGARPSRCSTGIILPLLNYGRHAHQRQCFALFSVSFPQSILPELFMSAKTNKVILCIEICKTCDFSETTRSLLYVQSMIVYDIQISYSAWQVEERQ